MRNMMPVQRLSHMSNIVTVVCTVYALKVGKAQTIAQTGLMQSIVSGIYCFTAKKIHIACSPLSV